MAAYYNEFDPYAAQWLRNLIAAGHIAAGDVDERSIVDVRADDLRGYTQCHFFAGIGGWSVALRLAGWDDTRPVWTGSCPCQPFSTVGKNLKQLDERHLWPHWYRLIRESKPTAVFGEQVESAITSGWLDDAFTDLENQGYSCAAAVLSAFCVGAPHKRDRLFFIANSKIFSGELQQIERENLSDFSAKYGAEGAIGIGFWGTEPAVGRVANGVPARVGRLRAYGNAIVPQVAAEFIKAAM
jgi:DNA (cytosine-5)-methyltransferase 1